MPNVETSFDDEEIEDIKHFAEQMNMTETEFVEYATKKYVKTVKETAKQKLQTEPKFRVYK